MFAPKLLAILGCAIGVAVVSNWRFLAAVDGNGDGAAFSSVLSYLIWFVTLGGGVAATGMSLVRPAHECL
jgi:SNF family Na+-dependent transporter